MKNYVYNCEQLEPTNSFFTKPHNTKILDFYHIKTSLIKYFSLINLKLILNSFYLFIILNLICCVNKKPPSNQDNSSNLESSIVNKVLPASSIPSSKMNVPCKAKISKNEITNIDNKVIVITGASSGIGKCTASLLNRKGYTVYGLAPFWDEMKKIEKEGVKILKMDLTNDKSIVEAINTILKNDGKIDVIVNCAGYGLYGSVEETSIKDAKDQFEVNFFGLARITQLVLPHMRKLKSGKIINISSMASKIYSPLGAWYHSSKYALEGWSHCLRTEVKQFGIDVIIIEPGVINTPFNDAVTERLLERSGKGPYKEIAKPLAQKIKSLSQKNGSDPMVIAQKIFKIIKSKNPHTIYTAGKYSRLFPFVQRRLGDRLYDKALIATLK